jgi:hypothetical protein
MAVYSVAEVASVGVVVDVDPVLLPPPAWTEVKNVRFTDQAAEKFTGHTSVATPAVTPYYAIPVIKGTTAYWVYAGTAAVYAWDGTTPHLDITRQLNNNADPYTGTVFDLWNGGLIQGVLVLNNGVDDPQMWVSGNLESLQWDGSDTWATKGYTAKIIRPYKEHLVALDWNDSSEAYHQTVYWSNKADTNSVPSDWDFADPANEAGLVDLAATPGYIVDGEQLRDGFAIYKEDSIYLMQYVGGQYVMNIRDVSKTTGALTQRCAREFYGRHFVMAQDDIIVHDGQTIESLADKRIRRKLFSDIDPAYYLNSYVTRNLARQEMWLCYTEVGATLPTRAAVWNWRDNTWTFRELPQMPHIAFGVLPTGTGSSVWDTDNASWDSDTETWGERLYNPAQQRLIGVTANDLFALDQTTLFGADPIDSYLIREGILLDSQPTLKMLKAVYPRAQGGAMQVSVGARFSVADPYTWEGPYTFTPGTDSVVRVRSTGRFHAIKFCFCASGASSLHGYDLEYEVVGRR